MFQYEREVQIEPDAARDKRVYWAAEEDTHKLASSLKSRIDGYRRQCDTTGRTDLWRRALRMYYGLDPTGGRRSSHAVTLGGTQGQRVELRGNMYRAILRSSLVMTAGSRPSFQCRAVAYDASATETVKIGNALLDKTLDDGVERAMIDVVEHCGTLGEGWISVIWDDAGGRTIGVDETNGRIVHAGALRTRTHRPDEVIRDPSVLEPRDHSWVMLTVQRNRWELAAQYPDYREEILGAPATRPWIFDQMGQPTDIGTGADDVVMTYEFYHRRTDAMPLGRSAIMVGDCIIAIGDLPYSDIPAHAMIVTREPTSCFGYADSWDLLALQQAFDSVLTQIVTTREHFGLQRFFVPSGHEYDATALSEAFSIISGSAPPVPLDYSSTGVENGTRVMDTVKGLMQVIMGMNDVAMGDASKSQSGAALAQMQAIASQFNSQNQFAYVSCFENVMNAILELYKTRASEEQIVQIAGRNNVYSVRSFRAEDLRALDGVKVEIGSAALRTLPMRHQIAQELSANPTQPITPEQFLAVVSTGRLEPATSMAATLEAMCERLIVEVQEGRGYSPTLVMPHHLLIPRLSELMSQPGVDVATTQRCMQLIMTHAEMWQSGTLTPQGQTVFAALGIPPAAGAGMAAQMQAPPMSPEQQGAPVPPGPSGNPEQLPAMQVPSAPMGPGAANMPSMPAESQPIPPMA